MTPVITRLHYDMNGEQKINVTEYYGVVSQNYTIIGEQSIDITELHAINCNVTKSHYMMCKTQISQSHILI